MFKKALFTTMVLGMTTVASVAMAAVTSTEALEIAKAETSPTAVVFGYEEKFHKFEVKLQDKENMTRYEVDVDKATGRVMELDIKTAGNSVSSNVVKSAADIRAIVLAEYPDAQISSVKLDREDYGHKYEVKFHNAKYRLAELDINPESGAIVKRDFKYNF